MEKLRGVLVLVLISAGFFVLAIQVANAAITIRTGSSCSGGEVCLFSAWNLSNSHVGGCGYYTNYTVCSDEVSSATVRTTLCTASENDIVFFNPVSGSNVNNSHVSLIETSVRLCVPSATYSCTVRNSCGGSETCMGSISNQTNAHFASCGFYSYQICCGADTTPPTILSEALNTTSVFPNEAVKFTVNVTDNFNVSKVVAEVRYPNGTLTNFTMGPDSSAVHNFTYNFVETVDSGNYVWLKTYANDTAGNTASNPTTLNFRVKGLTYSVSGAASDSFTGETISSGSVTAIVKETGDTSTGTITNGVYSVNIRTSLNTNETIFTVGLVFKSGGKIGYSQVLVGSGETTSVIQTCSFKTWRFRGLASDALTGGLINTGTVSVNVNDKEEFTYSNSTAFSNGQWDITIRPCLILGDTYDFEFAVTDSTTGKRNQFISTQVASS